jgi:predicted short-subunit dehydrogenase-like oxidoreductase (DUF2520 family)
MRTAPCGGWNVERGLVTTFRIIGPGRAGSSLAAALGTVDGFASKGILGRHHAVVEAASGVDVLFVATPDDEVARVASLIAPVPTTAVVHLSGSLGLEVLRSHPRRGSLHPLVPLPNPAIGAQRLCSGVTFAVAGDPVTRLIAEALGGRAVTVEDSHRTAYHAAAAIAANHMVALIGQVERVAAAAGLPLEAFAGLMRAATDDALSLGPRRALTGPAARGDWETVEAHRRVLGSMAGHRSELAAYDALVGLARRLSLEAATGQDGQATGRVEDTRSGAEVDVPEVDTAGVDMAGVDMAGVDMAGVDVAGVDVAEEDLAEEDVA